MSKSPRITMKQLSNCPLHNQLIDEAIRSITNYAVFSIDHLVKICNFGAIAGSIKWNYIKEAVEDQTGTTLIPVVKKLFRGKVKITVMTPKGTKMTKFIGIQEDVTNHPGKYLAGGNYRDTAGFTTITFNPALTIAKSKTLVSQTKGQENGARTFITAVCDAHIAPKVMDKLQQRLTDTASKTATC